MSTILKAPQATCESPQKEKEISGLLRELDSVIEKTQQSEEALRKRLECVSRPPDPEGEANEKDPSSITPVGETLLDLIRKIRSLNLAIQRQVERLEL
jgi:predicted patatin/cPLA2 family phospholipase